MADSRTEERITEEFSRWKRDAMVAGIAGVVAAVVMGLAAFLVGRIGGGEARVLVESIIPTSRFLCSAVMTAAATILALMLTLIGMTASADVDLKGVFYERIKQVALFDTVALCAATAFLLMHCVPVVKSDEIDAGWYLVIYYVTLGISAMLGGLIVVVVVMLYSALVGVIAVVGLDETGHRFVDGDVDSRESADAEDA